MLPVQSQAAGAASDKATAADWPAGTPAPDARFWGLVTAISDVDAVIQASGLHALEAKGIGFQIWRQNPDGIGGLEGVQEVLFGTESKLPGISPRWQDPSAEFSAALQVPGVCGHARHHQSGTALGAGVLPA